jgi:hypothetical protein
MNRVADMTLEELTALINQVVDRRLELLLGTFDLAADDEPDPRSLEDIYASIDRHMWTPPPGTPTTTELLRQDRDYGIL